jgi:stage II sporulation protein D
MKAVLAAVGAASLVAAAARPGHLDTWRRDAAGVVSGAADADRAVPVGSLQKPFVAEAWAAAHPHEPTPRWRCDGRSCWRPSGHGTLGLARATAVSCNAFFLALAAETPPGLLRSTLEAEGFVVDGTMTPEVAIGLGDTVTITPRRLLEAYARLTRTPWLAGDSVHREVLGGLRWAAEDGTARGVGRRGVWSKTGTVDSPHRRGLETLGWAVAVDDGGTSVLARLSPGTGRLAAAALGPLLGRRAATPAAVADGLVRVALFEAMAPRSIRVINRASAPVAGPRGFVGPGAALWLQPGDALRESLWQLSLSDPALRRTVKAALEVRPREGGGLEVVAAMQAREYVTGVLGAELGGGTSTQRVALGAAALRLRARGPRHAHADLCDTTHCAWFIGRGPRLLWPSPTRAIAQDDAVPPVQDEEWARMVEASRRPGPMYWTTHCGGRPLSEYAVWGSGDRTAASCPLHATGTAHPWTRSWSDDAVARAFGGPVTRLEVAPEEGVFRILVETPGRTRRLLYDDAHRALATVLGWDALPSPPDRVTRTAAGYRASGVGSGHRVGLCLGGGSGSASGSARGGRTDGDDHPLELAYDHGLGFRGTE